MGISDKAESVFVFHFVDDCPLTPDNAMKRLEVTADGKDEKEQKKNAFDAALAKGWSKVTIELADGVHVFMCNEKSTNANARRFFPTQDFKDGLELRKANAIAKRAAKLAAKTMPSATVAPEKK